MRQNLAAIGGDKHQILNADSRVAGQINARLYGEYHPFLRNRIAGGADIRRLMHHQANTVARACDKGGAIPRIDNHLTHCGVYLAHPDAGTDKIDTGLLGAADDLIDLTVLFADLTVKHSTCHVTPIVVDRADQIDQH